MWKDFKAFALKGNVLDLAVGVIIGAAFGKIVSSIVNDLLMPVFGLLLGGLNFSSLSITFGEANIQYGAFIQTVLDFLIVAVSIFVIIKILNRIKRKEDAKPAAPAAPSKEEVLLGEIRDLLKKQQGTR